MKFDFESLMELANEFDKKAEQLLETAASIRETASMMAAGLEPARATPEETPTESTPATDPAPIVVSPPRDFPAATEPDGNINPTTLRKIPKRLIGKTKLTALEALVVQALEDRPSGVHKDKIITYAKKNGHMGTRHSITGALVRLKKMGMVTPVSRATYALANPLNTN